MSLPSLIEIVPLATAPDVEITIPGSKSITNRALVLAALGSRQTTLRGALWSEDTQVMVEALQRLGFVITVETDPSEICNRHITIQGLGGKVPAGGTERAPLELFVGNAGTVARFLAALLCLGKGVYRLHGVPRMHERPQAELLFALRELGYQIDSADGRLPALIHGGGPNGGHCRVGLGQSSQFASALLLCAATGGWRMEIEGGQEKNSPYVAMTSKLIDSFPPEGSVFQVEPDASGGSCFWAAGYLLAPQGPPPIRVAHWPQTNWQIDADFPQYLPLPATLSRHDHLGDSIMTAVVIASFARQPVVFNDLGRLRLQECERVRALRTELTRCGAEVVEEGDSLTVSPSMLHGAEIHTYEDHRMAMCFAILGLKVPGMRIKNPACVRKTFPNFFQKLAEKVPRGLGVGILHGVTGSPLSPVDLSAE